jgi:hypothetical protein
MLADQYLEWAPDLATIPGAEARAHLRMAFERLPAVTQLLLDPSAQVAPGDDLATLLRFLDFRAMLSLMHVMKEGNQMGDQISSRGSGLSLNWTFWVLWVVASTAAILVAVVVLYALIFLAKAIVPGVNEDRLFGVLMFPVLAALLGLFQWLILRRQVRRSGWWIAATVLGILVGMAVTAGIVAVWRRMLVRELNMEQLAPMVLAVFGLSLGLAQLPVILRHIRGPALWVLASAAGWLGLGLVIGRSIDRTTDILALGAVPAVVTGLALVWLWREPSTHQSATSRPVS